MEAVFDPALPLPASAAIAQELVAGDTSCLARLLRSAESGSEADIMRLVDCLERMPPSPEMQFALQELVTWGGKHVQSKAASVLGRKFPDRAWLERSARRILQSRDPRVRANAVEGLWHVQHDRVEELFLAASKDPHHRVIANAAIGLHLLQHGYAPELMRRLAADPKAFFRAGGAFAMGESRDVKFLPDLRELLRDSVKSVRSASIRAVMKVQQSRSKS